MKDSMSDYCLYVINNNRINFNTKSAKFTLFSKCIAIDHVHVCVCVYMYVRGDQNQNQNQNNFIFGNI